jgi:hypothetical protein
MWKKTTKRPSAPKITANSPSRNRKISLTTTYNNSKNNSNPNWTPSSVPSTRKTKNGPTTSTPPSLPSKPNYAQNYNNRVIPSI